MKWSWSANQDQIPTTKKKQYFIKKLKFFDSFPSTTINTYSNWLPLVIKKTNFIFRTQIFSNPDKMISFDSFQWRERRNWSQTLRYFVSQYSKEFASPSCQDPFFVLFFFSNTSFFTAFALNPPTQSANIVLSYYTITVFLVYVFTFTIQWYLC